MRVLLIWAVALSSLLSMPSSADLKQINDQSIKASEEYFYKEFAYTLLDGVEIETASKVLFGVAPVAFGSVNATEGITQSAHMIPSRDFILVTLNTQSDIDKPFSVGITRYITEIPYEEIIYRAYDSKVKNGRRTFYMGDGASNGIKVRNLVEYAEQPERMATWMYLKIK